MGLFEVFKKMQDNKCKYYEWDEATFVIPKEFQLGISSELADALNVFWSAGGLDFFNVNDPKYYASNWLEFMGAMYSKIADGEFVAIDKTYHVPLSDEQKEELVRRGVPAVFITDLKN